MQITNCPEGVSTGLKTGIEQFNEKVNKSACDAVKKNSTDGATSAMIIVAIAFAFFISSILLFQAFPIVAVIVLLVGCASTGALSVLLSISKQMGFTLLGPLAKVETNEKLQEERASLMDKIEQEESNHIIDEAFNPLDWASLMDKIEQEESNHIIDEAFKPLDWDSLLGNKQD
jgi:uncharacterized protein YacL